LLSQPQKIVIIGCGAGGGTAAQFARKTDRKAHITVFEIGKYSQYSKCGLPYVISGTIPTFNDLIEFPEEWFQKARIELFLGTIVEHVDTKKQIISAKKGNQHIERPYDRLILATGATPALPPIKGLEQQGKIADGIHVLRTIDDGKRIVAHLRKGKKATVIGAGLIGLELADALYSKGMNVTVVETLPSLLANTLDEDMASLVHEECAKHVRIFSNYRATHVGHTKESISKVFVTHVETGEQQEIDTDILVIATGTKPEASLAKQIGCSIGKTGGIIVNEKSETSIPHVYAVGDCTQYRDFVTGGSVCIGLGSVAVRQGIAAGINAAGGAYTLPKGVLLARTSDFFGIEIAAVGPVTSNMHDCSLVSGKFTGSSLPEYFPGGKPITIKLMVDDTTHRICAAQAVGANAAQRINTFACAILNTMTVDALRTLETAYAPPIAPTLDAVTLVCDVVFLKLARKKG